jgi:hypothetical protein
MVMIDTKLLTNYLDQKGRISAIEEDLKAKKRDLKDMEAAIISMLSTEGARHISVHGKTIAPRRVMRASSSNMPLLIEAMKAEGLDALVGETVNAQRLTGWANDFDPERMCSAEELKARLPESVRDYINLYEQHTLSVTNS